MPGRRRRHYFLLIVVSFSSHAACLFEHAHDVSHALSEIVLFHTIVSLIHFLFLGSMLNVPWQAVAYQKVLFPLSRHKKRVGLEV